MQSLFPYLNILIIPTDYCNMRCIYCFHNEHYITKKNNCIMSENVLNKLFSSVLPYYKTVNFIWHGGEPLSVGIDFYKNVVELQKKYNINNTKINNSIQTNLTLMDDEIATFLVENNFGVGSSHDGIMNDVTRGNSNQIIKGREILLNHGGKCGFIQVISGLTLNSLIESYEFFKINKVSYSMNNYFSSGHKENQLELDLDNYVTKIISFYDYWTKDINCNIDVEYFHRIISFIVSKTKSVCIYNSCLGKWISVKPNGDVTPCNRFFPQEYTYGNINDYSKICDVFNSTGFIKLLEKSVERRRKCSDCEIYDFCNGGCNFAALNENGIEYNQGFSCNSTKIIYKYISDNISYIKNNIEDDEFRCKLNPHLLRMLMSDKKHI